jgi:hypothetical protein
MTCGQGQSRTAALPLFKVGSSSPPVTPATLSSAGRLPRRFRPPVADAPSGTGQLAIEHP